MTKEDKLKAMIAAFHAVEKQHHVVVDKYVSENGETKYRFKLQFEDVDVDLEEIFTPVYHGPPKDLN